jgi:hypothetical protein
VLGRGGGRLRELEGAIWEGRGTGVLRDVLSCYCLLRDWKDKGFVCGG